MLKLAIIVAMMSILLYLVNIGGNGFGIFNLLPSSAHTSEYNLIAISFLILFLWGLYRITKHKKDTKNV